MSTTLASGAPFRTESEYYLGDGTRRTVDLALSPLVDDEHDGPVQYLVATGTDITDARAAHAAASRRSPRSPTCSDAPRTSSAPRSTP